MTATQSIIPVSTMREVLEAFPGAQRALFRRYHIGGCSSCAFRPDETLVQVCERNANLNVDEVVEHIKSSHELDAKIFITPKDLADWRNEDPSVRLVDVRSREEFLNLLQHLRKPINFFRCIIKVEARSRGGFDAQFAHQRLIAMMPAAQSDTPLISHSDDVMRVNAIQ